MNWYIGQKVVLLTDITIEGGIAKKGDEFIISGLKSFCTDYPVIINIGLISPSSHSKLYECTVCKHFENFNGERWIIEKWIVPLEEKTDEVKSEFKEVTFTKIKELVPMTSVN